MVMLSVQLWKSSSWLLPIVGGAAWLPANHVCEVWQ